MSEGVTPSELGTQPIGEGPKSPYVVSRVLFRGAITIRQRCSALVETLAHLDHLVLEGRAGLVKGATVAYRAG